MIKYPERFNQARPAGFDGVWDWDFITKAFKRGISPMDFDGVVECNNQFLVFETKDKGVPISNGQSMTLQAAHNLGCFTIIFIYGKTNTEEVSIWYPNGIKTPFVPMNNDQLVERCRAWFEWADNL